MVKAVISGNRIECGKCGELIAKVAKQEPKNKLPNELRLTEGIKTTVTMEEGTYKPENCRSLVCENGFLTSLEIKCKHKDKGQYCNTINEILL